MYTGVLCVRKLCVYMQCGPIIHLCIVSMCMYACVQYACITSYTHAYVCAYLRGAGYTAVCAEGVN